MLFNSAAVMAVLAAISQVTAEPMPYKPEINKMSVRHVFGVVRRQGGYYPGYDSCGSGATCAEACGEGSIICSGRRGGGNCYNPGIGQTCCLDDYGNGCDTGYSCTSDSKGDTYCCPEEMSLPECAAAYGVGKLTSQLGEPTSTSTPSGPTTPTTTPATSTPTTSTSTTSTLTTSVDTSTTPTPTGPSTTPSIPNPISSTTTSLPAPPTISTTPVPGGNGGNGTHSNTTIYPPGSTQPTSAVVTANAVSLVHPIVVMALLVAGAFAVLL